LANAPFARSALGVSKSGGKVPQVQGNHAL